MPECSAPDRCSSSGCQKSHTPSQFFLENEREITTFLFTSSFTLRPRIPHTAKTRLKLTLRVLFRVMHSEEQREGWADRFLATATEAAVLNFTTKQLSDYGLTRGAQRTATTLTQHQQWLHCPLTWMWKALSVMWFCFSDLLLAPR